jgi:hypothetical protein
VHNSNNGGAGHQQYSSHVPSQEAWMIWVGVLMRMLVLLAHGSCMLSHWMLQPAKQHPC